MCKFGHNLGRIRLELLANSFRNASNRTKDFPITGEVRTLKDEGKLITGDELCFGAKAAVAHKLRHGR